MTKEERKISKIWIERNRLLFDEFLEETEFPDTKSTGGLALRPNTRNN
jgi:hypothetical protein